MIASIMCPNCGIDNPPETLFCQGCGMSLTHIKERFQSGMKQLFLCFFGDGGLWENVLLVPAYPAGYSYFRQFRYTDDLVERDLLSDIANPQERRTVVGRNAWLCMRFRSDEHKWKLLPVRKVKITHIDYLPETHSVFFRMGLLFDFTGIDDLQESCVEIREEERDSIGNSLFFRSRVTIPESRLVGQENEDTSWAKFCDLVCGEKTLPLRREAKQGLFLRFREPSREQRSPTRLIHRSWHRGRVYGSILPEGTTYELVLLHRIPALIPTDASVKFPVEYKVATGNIELSRSGTDLTGNFQTHVLSVTGVRPSATSEELIIAPKEESVEAEDGQRINAVELAIPLKVIKDVRYRLRTIGIRIIGLWFALFVSGAIGPIREGKTDIAAMAVSAVASACATLIIVYALPQATIPK